MLKTKNHKGNKGETGSNIQRSSSKTINGFLKRNTTIKKGLALNMPDYGKPVPTTKTTLPSKALI